MSDPHQETIEKIERAQGYMRRGDYRRAQEILGPPDPQLAALVAWAADAIKRSSGNDDVPTSAFVAKALKVSITDTLKIPESVLMAMSRYINEREFDVDPR